MGSANRCLWSLMFSLYLDLSSFRRTFQKRSICDSESLADQRYKGSVVKFQKAAFFERFQAVSNSRKKIAGVTSSSRDEFIDTPRESIPPCS